MKRRIDVTVLVCAEGCRFAAHVGGCLIESDSERELLDTVGRVYGACAFAAGYELVWTSASDMGPLS
jgi:hypothetical protein